MVKSPLKELANLREDLQFLLTDGMDNADTIPLEVAIKRAKKYGIKVYTIGVGRDGVDFNSAILRKIAKETGGDHFKEIAQKLPEILRPLID